MKKTIIILLILSICVALFACNRTENDESSDAPKDESSAVVEENSNEESVVSGEASDEASDEVSEEPREVSVAEVIPAAQLQTMDKEAIVSYAKSLLDMIDNGISEISDDFFYPEKDEDLPSPDDEGFAKIQGNTNLCLRIIQNHDFCRYDFDSASVETDNKTVDAIWGVQSAIANSFLTYKRCYENGEYDEARNALASISNDYYNIIFEKTEVVIMDKIRSAFHDDEAFDDRIDYHPQKYRLPPYRNYVSNEKNSDLSRSAIQWFYGYSSLTDSKGDGYAAALYPYGVLSVCRYPSSYDVFDDFIVIETTLPLRSMDISTIAGETMIKFDPYGDYYGKCWRFRVRPNCAFDSAEILPIDEENEEVTFVLYDENGDEIKRITFNYMTYVFRETYPA